MWCFLLSVAIIDLLLFWYAFSIGAFEISEATIKKWREMDKYFTYKELLAYHDLNKTGE